MKSLPIPEDEQILSLLRRTFVQKIGEYVAQPRDTDYMTYFTVNGSKVVAYLKAHPKEAADYFAGWSEVKTTHDVPRIWREGPKFCVASFDHGKPMDTATFASLEEAVASHVCLEFGLPKD